MSIINETLISGHGALEFTRRVKAASSRKRHVKSLKMKKKTTILIILLTIIKILT